MVLYGKARAALSQAARHEKEFYRSQGRCFWKQMQSCHAYHRLQSGFVICTPSRLLVPNTCARLGVISLIHAMDEIKNLEMGLPLLSTRYYSISSTGSVEMNDRKEVKNTSEESFYITKQP